MDNNSKPFELGVTVGRFQSFHAGHEYMINTAVKLCGRVGIFVGSSQESGTRNNPFSYETRERVLKKLFGDTVSIFPLPDIGVGNNSSWGDYVLKNINDRFGCPPDLLVSGKEARRVDWFDSTRGITVAELYVPKIIDISGTRMREFFISDNREEWQRHTNPVLWDEYDLLREEMLAAQDNLYTESL